MTEQQRQDPIWRYAVLEAVRELQELKQSTSSGDIVRYLIVTRNRFKDAAGSDLYRTISQLREDGCLEVQRADFLLTDKGSQELNLTDIDG